MQDFGKLLLRLVIGGLMLFHGIKKIMNTGAIDWIAGQLATHHLPDFLKYGVYAGEVLGPALVVLGFLTRPGALMIAIDMVAATYLAKMGAVTSTDAQTGAWGIELEAMYFLGSLAILCLGSGRFALSGGRGRLN